MESFKEMMDGMARNHGSWWTSEFAKGAENDYGVGSDYDRERKAKKAIRTRRNFQSAGTPVFNSNGKIREVKNAEKDDVPYEYSPMRTFDDRWGISRTANMVSQGTYWTVNAPYIYVMPNGKLTNQPREAVQYGGHPVTIVDLKQSNLPDDLATLKKKAGKTTGYTFRPMGDLRNIQNELQRSADNFAFESWLDKQLYYKIKNKIQSDLGIPIYGYYYGDVPSVTKEYADELAKRQLKERFNNGEISSEMASDPAVLKSLADRLYQEKAVPLVQFVRETNPEKVRKLTTYYRMHVLPDEKRRYAKVRAREAAEYQDMVEQAEKILADEIAAFQEKDLEKDPSGNTSKIDTSTPDAWAKGGYAYIPPSKFGYGEMKTNDYGDTYQSYNNEFKRILRNLYALKYGIVEKPPKPKEEESLPSPDEPGITEEEKIKRQKAINFKEFADSQAEARALAEKKTYADDRRKESLDELNYQRRRKQAEEDHEIRQIYLRFKALQHLDEDLMPESYWRYIKEGKHISLEEQNKRVNEVYDGIHNHLKNKAAYLDRIKDVNTPIEELNRLAIEAAQPHNDPAKHDELQKRFHKKLESVCKTIDKIMKDKNHDKAIGDFGYDNLKAIRKMNSREYVAELEKDKKQPGSGVIIKPLSKKALFKLWGGIDEDGEYGEVGAKVSGERGRIGDLIKTIEAPIISENKLHEMMMRGEDPRDNPAVMANLEQSGLTTSGLLPAHWLRQFTGTAAIRKQREHENTREYIDELHRQVRKDIQSNRTGDALPSALRMIYAIASDDSEPEDLQKKAKDVLAMVKKELVASLDPRSPKAVGSRVPPEPTIPHYPEYESNPYEEYMLNGGRDITENIMRARRNSRNLEYLMPFFRKITPKLNSIDPQIREEAEAKVLRFIKDYIYPDIHGRRAIDDYIGSRVYGPLDVNTDTQPEEAWARIKGAPKKEKDKTKPAERKLEIKAVKDTPDVIERSLRALQDSGVTVDIDGKPTDFLHVVDRIYDGIMSDINNNPPIAESNSKSGSVFGTYYPYHNGEIGDQLASAVTPQLIDYLSWAPESVLTGKDHAKRLRELIDEDIPHDPNDETQGTRKRSKPEVVDAFMDEFDPDRPDSSATGNPQADAIATDGNATVKRSPKYNALRKDVASAMRQIGHQNMLRKEFEKYGIDTSKVPDPSKEEKELARVSFPVRQKSEPQVAINSEVTAGTPVTSATPASPSVAPVAPSVTPTTPLALKPEPTAPVVSDAMGATPTIGVSGDQDLDNKPTNTEVPKEAQRNLDDFYKSRAFLENMQDMSIREMMSAIAKSDSKEGHPYGKPVQGSTFVFGSTTATLGDGKEPVMPVDIPKGETNGEGATSKEITL